jgi:alkylation response protein AidB-like acyl-CoA dehydrogenase
MTMQALDERAELARAIAEVVAAEMPLTRLREVAEKTSFDRGFWDTLVESGLLSVLVPESLGGLGLTIQDATGIFYELGRNPVPGPVLDNAVAAPLLRAAASDPGLLDETAVVAFVDPAATTWSSAGATSAADGRLTGRAELVRSPSTVDAFLVVAAGVGGTSVFVVPGDAAGVRVEGDHPLEFGARYGTVSFDVAISDATELVAGPGGAAAVEATRTALRLAMAAEVAGAGKVLLDLSTAYALVRSQFGQTIASFQGLQQILAETYEYSSALDSLLEWCVDELASADPATASQIGSKAKAGAAEFGRLIAENALQVHGGIGFTAEHDVNVFYKLILAREAHYGDKRSLAGAIGRGLLSTP